MPIPNGIASERFSGSNMGLADRIIHIENGDQVGDIAVHTWTAAFNLYAAGEATRAELSAVFSLSAQDLVGLDTLKSEYDGLTTEAEKIGFVLKLEHAGLFYERGTIDKARYMQIMGL